MENRITVQKSLTYQEIEEESAREKRQVVYVFCGVILFLATTSIPWSTQEPQFFAIYTLLWLCTIASHYLMKNDKMSIVAILWGSMLLIGTTISFLGTGDGIQSVSLIGYIFIPSALAIFFRANQKIVFWFTLLTLFLISIVYFTEPVFFFYFPRQSVPKSFDASLLISYLVIFYCGSVVAARAIETHTVRLRRLDQSKDRLFESVSHELRDPLHTILGYSAVLKRNLKNGPLHEDALAIEESGLHLLNLVNNLLDSAKISEGHMEISRAMTTIKKIHDDVIVLTSGLIEKSEKSNLIFESSFEDSDLFVDEARIKQIVFNLLSNAIRFTENGKICLKIYRSKDGVFHFQVDDTGIGIKQEKIDSLFGRFEQLDKKASVGGSGLGLFISRELARLHDGEILVQSELGKGSTFTLKIRG